MKNILTATPILSTDTLHKRGWNLTGNKAYPVYRITGKEDKTKITIVDDNHNLIAPYAMMFKFDNA